VSELLPWLEENITEVSHPSKTCLKLSCRRETYCDFALPVLGTLSNFDLTAKSFEPQLYEQQTEEEEEGHKKKTE
jgi:hypothetical protein